MRAASLFLTLCCCGGIVQGDDAAAGDGGMGDVADVSHDQDAKQDVACSITPPPSFPDKGCNAQRDAICQQWAQTLATYGASICMVPNGQFAKCGDPDCNGNCCGGGPVCLTDEVCASLTQGGPHQCVKACAGF